MFMLGDETTECRLPLVQCGNVEEMSGGDECRNLRRVFVVVLPRREILELASFSRCKTCDRDGGIPLVGQKLDEITLFNFSAKFDPVRQALRIAQSPDPD